MSVRSVKLTFGPEEEEDDDDDDSNDGQNVYVEAPKRNLEENEETHL